MTIKGASLRASGDNVDTMTFAGVDAEIVSEEDTVVIVVASVSGAIQGNVVLTAETAATVTEAGGWTYLEQGAVTAVTPAEGQRGTEVSITGSALRGGGNSVDKVTLGGVEVWKLVTETDTEVTVVVPRADAAADTNVVLTADTGAVVTALSAWTYLAEGEITSVGPESGQVGTRVTIEGTSLFGGGDALESVTLAGVDVKIISANDSIAIVVIEDPSTGTGSVVPTSNTGAIVSVDDASHSLMLARSPLSHQAEDSTVL